MLLEKIRSVEVKDKDKDIITSNIICIRYNIIKYFLFLIFLIILVRSLELQIFQSKKLDKIAIQQYQNFKNLETQRGKILDSKGNILSFSIPYYSAFILTKQIKDKQIATVEIAKVLGEEPQKLAKKIYSSQKFIWIKKFFNVDLKKKLENLKIEGVHIVRDFQRQYPLENFASHILGFVGHDSKGLEGIEYKYNKHLLQKELKNVSGNESFSGKIYEGRNIFLTIDENIQYFTQKKLSEYAQKYQTKYAQAIVMDTKTATILALANYPSYNPNNFKEYDNNIYFNRVVNASYEPGSTFKVITMAAALEEKVITENQEIYCEQGSIFIGGSVINDPSPQGYLTPEKILQKSSNICALKIGRRLAAKKFYQYIKKFGFGEKTGIELPGEAKGSVRDYKKWSLLDLVTTSYGHSISVTPIQLISAVNVIANDGIYLSPSIVQKMENALQDEVSDSKRTSQRVISSQTAKIMRKILVSVTEIGGTGRSAKILGIDIGGKTGTTKKYDKELKNYSEKKHILSFVGFFPAQKPELTILVILDEPQNNSTKVYSAAPLFKEIATHAIRYWRLSDSYEKKWAIYRK